MTIYIDLDALLMAIAVGLFVFGIVVLFGWPGAHRSGRLLGKPWKPEYGGAPPPPKPKP